MNGGFDGIDEIEVVVWEGKMRWRRWVSSNAKVRGSAGGSMQDLP